jgi:hypothetical protein
MKPIDVSIYVVSAPILGLDNGAPERANTHILGLVPSIVVVSAHILGLFPHLYCVIRLLLLGLPG